MGKPFKQELEKLSSTIKFVQEVDVNELIGIINKLTSKSLYIIGSGGSFSACHFAELLHHERGNFGKAITPLESYYFQKNYKDSNVLIITASGRNKDILFAFDQAIKNEPEYIVNICSSISSPLFIKAKNFSLSKTFEYPLPSGKDGFLASNSLISFFILLARGYGFNLNKEKFDINASKKFQIELETFLHNIDVTSATFKILYGGWSKPVAIDMESKLTEAALANSLLTDYRNFGHGRHHWFDKKRQNSAIVALVTPDEENLAKKTLALLPKDIPVLLLVTKKTGPSAAIELLIKSFYLIDKIGELQNIDPGKPGVPEFGSKLYHLSYNKFYNNTSALDNKINLFIQRKIKPTSLKELSSLEFKKWNQHLNDFTLKITKTKFGCIVLDYDRTLCSDENRLLGPSKEIVSELVKLLKAGFLIGIVTGRGKSIRLDLQKCIAKTYWNSIVIGYYNGAEIGELSNNSFPTTSEKHDPIFLQIQDLLKDTSIINSIEIVIRPFQLTIECKKPDLWEVIKSVLYQKTMLVKEHNFMLVESSRSIDIIKRPEVSKLNIITYLEKRLNEMKLPNNCLCIGDKGKWPGNDFELLNTPYSLSVNEVSLDPSVCWNLSPLGIRNTDSCFIYLKHLTLHTNYFNISI